MKLLRTVLFLLIWPTLLFAESVELAGVNFPIQEFTQIDSSTVKISVLGKPKIVRQENANDEIVRQFFASWDKTNTLGIEKITDFCAQAIAEGNENWALIAFDALALTFADKQDETIASLEKIIDSNKDKRSFLTKLLDFPSSTQYRAKLLGAILFLTAVEDVSWVKKNKRSDIQKYSEQIKAYAEPLILKNVRAANTDLSNRQLDTLTALYSVVDPTVKRVKSEVLVFLGPAHGLRESPGAAKTAFKAFREASNYTPESERVFLPLIHAQAERSLAAGKPLEALKYLALVEINNRSPETHTLVVEALNKMDSEKLASLPKDVASFLGELSKHDERVARGYLGYFEVKFSKLLNEGNPHNAESQLKLIVDSRQDPDAENDKLRVALAISYLNLGLKSAAKEQINNIQTGIGVFTRLKFLFSGLYIPVPVLLFLLIVPLLGSVTYLARAQMKQRKISERRERRAYEMIREEEEEVSFKGFKARAKGGANDPLMQEYQALLQEFGLRGKVSARQIKSAYRKKAKRTHPDMKVGEESEEFLKLKKDYEHLLDLRKKLAID